MAKFYSAEGLKAIALFLDEILERQQLTSQNKLAEFAGIAPNSIRNLRRNRTNQGETIESEPHPDTLLSLAPLLIDPTTGRPFDPERFIRVARGKETLLGEAEKLPELPVVYPEAAEFYQARLEGKDVEAIAARLGCDLKRLSSILEGRLKPKTFESLRLSSIFAPKESADRLMALYGVTDETPLPSPNGSANGYRSSTSRV